MSNNTPPQQQNPPTFDQVIEAVNNTRDDILRTQSNASTTAITGYDGLTKYLQSAMKQIQDQTKEIIRLQELCQLNKIDYAIPSPPNPVIAPTPSTQELTAPPPAPKPRTTKD